MSVIPRTLSEQLDFFEQHLPVWAANPAAIGLTPVQIADLSLLVSEARAAFENAIDARESSRSATMIQSFAFLAMVTLGSDLIKTIKAFAETSGDNSVYGAAQIPPPAAPTPAGPPVEPTHLAANFLSPFGLGLSWKGSVAQGAYFGIWRRLGGETNYTLIATSKTKAYDDTTVPAGTQSVQYYISAHRDEFTVNSSVLALQFGAGGAGAGAGLSIAA